MENTISNNVNLIFDELLEISEYIHQNPELPLQEFKSSKMLADYLQSNGFDVERGIASLETSFKATFKQGNPKYKIGFLAEYDALPDMGHGCGHNLIGTMSCGGAVALSKSIGDLDAEIVVYGTPAEEGHGGKIIMLDKGYIKELDCALMIHPTQDTCVEDFSLANYMVKIDFYGKPAHAAAFPQEGRNALDGVIMLFNGVNAYKESTLDYTRIHGIITKGGTAPNIITDHAQADFSIRHTSRKYLDEIFQRVEEIAQGAALMTGTSVEVKKVGLSYDPVMNNATLKRIMKEKFELMGETVKDRNKDDGMGSTDMGNVTQAVPAIHSYISIGEGIATHTYEFAKACTGESGKRALYRGMSALAMAGYDLISAPENIEEAKQSFIEDKKSCC